MANGDGHNNTDLGNKIWLFYLWNEGKQDLETITKVFPVSLQQQHLAGWLLKYVAISKYLSSESDNTIDVHCR